MITIGFDGSRAFTRERTGTENYSYQLLQALAKIDKKNKYIVYLRTNSSVEKDRHVANAPRDDGYRWPKNFQFSILNFQFLWTQAGLALQTFRDPLDVLFVPAHTLPLIRRPGLKTVVTVHDLGAEYLPGMHQLKQRLYLNLMTRYQLKSATHLIAVSGATKDDLIKRVGIKADKISVIYEGYDREKFRVQSSEFRVDLLVNRLRYYGLVPGKYFLFVGTVQPRKNLDRLIKAFHKLLGVLPARYPAVHPRSTSLATATRQEPLLAVTPRKIPPDFAIPIKLVIVGSKGWLSDEIYQLPKKLGIEDRVKFLGYVPEKDLPALYSGAIALVFPSLFEGFGLPILEAQACGCPVITSNISSMPEVAGKGAIFVNPYDVDDIVKGMKRVQVTGNRLQLVKAGFENIKRFFWEKCAKETLKVLEGL